ncbi:MAG: hypothetical protein Tsb005_08860 [Gammaproteobacteria bacterium]
MQVWIHKKMIVTLGLVILGGIAIFAIKHSHAAESKQPNNLQNVSLILKTNHALTSEKLNFIHELIPIIDNYNLMLLNQRKKLHKLQELWHKQGHLTSEQLFWLKQKAQQYQINFNLHKPESWHLLKRRIDIIPRSLALAQAINESGWGNSRFAKQGYNLFGQWCYQTGCGIVPKKLPTGRYFEVKKFSSINESVASYMRNLNTNKAYTSLRIIRERLRHQEKKPTGDQLAQGLVAYSSQGDEYVKRIKKLIAHYQLQTLDGHYVT